MRKDICSFILVAVLGAFGPAAPLAAEPAVVPAADPAVAPAAAPAPTSATTTPAAPSASAGDAAPATPAAHDADAPASAAAAAPQSPPAPSPAAGEAASSSATPASPAPSAAVAPAALGPSTRALAVSPSAARPQTDWYVPKEIAAADKALNWNTSLLGGFDPWTKQKVTVLFQLQALELGFPGASGMTKYPQGDGIEDAANEYPDTTFSGDYRGVRLEWGNWSIAGAVADGKLDWAGVDDSGNPIRMSGKTYQAIISRGFGAWAVIDTASDIRIGFSWPELYVRLLYGEFEPGIVKSVKYGIAGAGVSLLGIRVTVGDLLFAEVRAGDYAIHAAVTQIDFGEEGVDADIIIQDAKAFSLRPTFRVGFVF